MSLIALRHSNRKETIRRASLKHLDAYVGSVMSAESEEQVILEYAYDDEQIGFLDLTRAAD
eukprot:1341147-Pyramimonas_sp.AAC.1